jgi:carbonyl reductase 1
MSAKSQRVAVVTGANKGVGFHIAEQIVKSGLFGTVIMACRDAGRGQAAAKQVGGIYMPLEVGNTASTHAFAEAVKSNFGRVDCLVNNAAIAFKAADPTPFVQQTKPTLDINLRGTLEVTEALLPLLTNSCVEDGRIVNVASMAGRLRQVSPLLQAAFSSPELTLNGVRSLADKFEADVAAGNHQANGWSNSNYAISKLALIAATNVLARQYPGLRVNACCPGYCDTDMSSHKGTRPPALGARNAVLLVATPAAQCPTGAFIQNEKLSEW